MGGWVRPLTLSHGEQVAEVSGAGLGLLGLGALDLAQHEEGVVVGGEVRQAEQVVALLRVQVGARHAAVQHLRKHDGKNKTLSDNEKTTKHKSTD